MAFLFCNSNLLLFIVSLSFFSCIPFVSSLSTVSISETNSNQTLICALIQPPNQKAFVLNCTSFPQGIVSPVNNNTSFSGIVAGKGFVCALSSQSPSPTSIIVCWRFSTNGTNMSSKRIYHGPAIRELVAGNSHICGLVNGKLECWQGLRFNPSMDHKFSSIAVGENFVCGVSEVRKISCLGNSTSVVGKEPNGTYSVVSAGFRHACALSLDNSLVCWGDEVGEKPQGKFISLALGENRSCALRLNETVVCWGKKNFMLPESLQGTYFIAIEAKRSVFCGVVKSNFSLYCWGNDIFQSNYMVFKKVIPGPCRSKCSCRPLAGTNLICGGQESICETCKGETPPLPPPSPPSAVLAPSPQSQSNGWDKRMVAFLVVGCVGSSALVLVCCFFLYRHCKGRGCRRVHDSGQLDETGNPAEIGPSQRHQPAAPVLERRLSHLVSLGNGGRPLEEFPLQMLLEATDKFSEDHKIGTGSFGSVYRATLDDGRDVAIKRAEISMSSPYANSRREEDKDNAFLNELEALSRLNHKNLVRLLGFCEDSNERVLVYEYMKNGNLYDHLHRFETSPLTSWPERINVALHAARGIEYLHVYAVPPIIHRDIKSSNILLDATWTAKVSDFGLSLMGPLDDESHLSLLAAGTVGYMDPEYYRLQQLTTKSDVYSFGVVLLEMLSGYKAIHKNENGVPRNVVDFVVPYIAQDEIHRVLDPKLPPPTPFEIEAVAYVGYLAVDCVSLEGRDRPSMTDIVNSLERALAACLIHPPLSRSTTGSST
jgi:hypothetical protein